MTTQNIQASNPNLELNTSAPATQPKQNTQANTHTSSPISSIQPAAEQNMGQPAHEPTSPPSMRATSTTHAQEGATLESVAEGEYSMDQVEQEIQDLLKTEPYKAELLKGLMQSIKQYFESLDDLHSSDHSTSPQEETVEALALNIDDDSSSSDDDPEMHILNYTSIYFETFDVNDNQQLFLRILKLIPTTTLINMMDANFPFSSLPFSNTLFSDTSFANRYRSNLSAMQEVMVNTVCSKIEQCSDPEKLPTLGLEGYTFYQKSKERFNQMFERLAPDAIDHYLNSATNPTTLLQRVATHHYIQSEEALNTFTRQLKFYLHDLHGRNDKLDERFHTLRAHLDLDNLTSEARGRIEKIINNIEFDFFIDLFIKQSHNPLYLSNIEKNSDSLSSLILSRIGFYLAQSPIKMLRDNIEYFAELTPHQLKSLFSRLSEQKKNECLLIALLEPLRAGLLNIDISIDCYLPLIVTLAQESLIYQQPVSSDLVALFNEHYQDTFSHLGQRMNAGAISDILHATLHATIIKEALKTYQNPFFWTEVTLDRANVAETVIKELLNASPPLSFRFRFNNEHGEDHGGLAREAYTLTHQALTADASIWESNALGELEPAAHLDEANLKRLYHLGCLWSTMLLEDIPADLMLSKPTWQCINFLTSKLDAISIMQEYQAPDLSTQSLTDILHHGINLLSIKHPTILIEAICILNDDNNSSDRLTKILLKWFSLDNPQEASPDLQKYLTEHGLHTSDSPLTTKEVLALLQSVAFATSIDELAEAALARCKHFTSVMALTLGFAHRDIFFTSILPHTSEPTHYLLFHKTNIRDALKNSLLNTADATEENEAHPLHRTAVHYLKCFIEDESITESDLHQLIQFITGLQVLHKTMSLNVAPVHTNGFVGRTCINQLDVPIALIEGGIEKGTEAFEQSYTQFKNVLRLSLRSDNMTFTIA